MLAAGRSGAWAAQCVIPDGGPAKARRKSGTCRSATSAVPALQSACAGYPAGMTRIVVLSRGARGWARQTECKCLSGCFELSSRANGLRRQAADPGPISPERRAFATMGPGSAPGSRPGLRPASEKAGHGKSGTDTIIRKSGTDTINPAHSFAGRECLNGAPSQFRPHFPPSSRGRGIAAIRGGGAAGRGPREVG